LNDDFVLFDNAGMYVIQTLYIYIYIYIYIK
jgi:hypothetical protein